MALESELPSHTTKQPYASMVSNRQASWSLFGNQGSLEAQQASLKGQMDVPPVDPQLSRSDPAYGNISDPRLQPDSSAVDLSSTKASGPCSNASTLVSSETVDRVLPSQDVKDDTLDDAYVAFIFYCNPNIPLDTDTLELRKTFRSPPKSDGKTFSTWELFLLIQKLETKKIKSWAQLAMDLGVEPPAIEKGQSAQKVQQYAVRLKRWMHAMHVDAFFEYLLGKNHIYWTQIPSIHDPPSDFPRDGVAADEDLALRALIPEFRPKRGRRKADDKDDGDLGKSPAQKARLYSPTLSEDFAMARASIVNMTPSTARSEWSATDTRISLLGRPTISIPTQRPSPSDQLQQWDSRGSDYMPHPQSAITPRAANPFLPYDGEPQSAITPSSARSRRRHGPAVSSAWPSTSNFSGGKLRGRPPSNRSVSDGPFSTFPANPHAKAGPTINLRDPILPVTSAVENVDTRNSTFALPNFLSSQRTQATKPSRLYLQVPERVGGDVRLATPPPTLLVNGESENNELFEMHEIQSQGATSFLDSISNSSLENYFRNDTLTSTDHEVDGKSTDLHGRLQSSSPSFRDEPGDDLTNIAELESKFIYAIIGASWFDHEGQPLETCTLEEADQVVKRVIQNLRDGATSKETFLIHLAALAGGEFLRSPYNQLRMTRLEGDDEYKMFTAKWLMKFGATEGSFDMKINVPRKASGTNGTTSDDAGVDDIPSEDWKKRYLELSSRLKEKDEKIRDLSKTVLNALASAQCFEVSK